MRKSWLVVVLALVAIAVGTCAGTASAAPFDLQGPGSFCITGPGGPYTVPPDATIPFEDGVTEIPAELVGLLESWGGVFYVGRLMFDGPIIWLPGLLDPSDFLEPGWNTYRISEGKCKAAAPPAVTHVAVCKLLPRADGTTGLFQVITVQDWNDPDGRYFDAPAANWIDGVGLMCEVPDGYKAAGYKVAWGGKAAADNDANSKRASGQNDIYPLYVKS